MIVATGVSLTKMQEQTHHTIRTFSALLAAAFIGWAAYTYHASQAVYADIARDARESARNLRTATWNASTVAWNLAGASDNLNAISGQLRDGRTGLVATLDKTLTDTQTGILDLANAQLTQLRADSMEAVQGTLGIADQRLSQAITVANGQLTTANGTVSQVAANLKPVLDNSAALVRDAQDSWDSNYDDVVSLLDSAEVATTQAAQTLQTINAVAPKIGDEAVSNGKNIDGITADVHTLTSALTKPKSWLGKLWAGIVVASRFAGLM